jgi:hypothetical protein
VKRNPNHPYVVVNSAPKVAKLRRRVFGAVEALEAYEGALAPALPCFAAGPANSVQQHLVAGDFEAFGSHRLKAGQAAAQLIDLPALFAVKVVVMGLAGQFISGPIRRVVRRS